MTGHNRGMMTCATGHGHRLDDRRNHSLRRRATLRPSARRLACGCGGKQRCPVPADNWSRSGGLYLTSRGADIDPPPVSFGRTQRQWFRLHQTVVDLEGQTQFGDIPWPREGWPGVFLDPAQAVTDGVGRQHTMISTMFSAATQNRGPVKFFINCTAT
jgi:hypothetical protein